MLAYCGVQVTLSENCLEQTTERLFPYSPHRSRRIHKKLVKRHGGVFRMKPCAFKVMDRLVMHPVVWQQLQAELRKRNEAQASTHQQMGAVQITGA